MPPITDLPVAVLSGFVQTFGVRVGAEQPQYVVLDRPGAIEVRRYEPRLAAETTVAGDAMAARNEGFRRIAGYIFGDNRARASIAMTSPVAQSAGAAGGRQTIAMTSPVVQAGDAEAGWRIQFLMPSKYRLDTLPAPNDAAVRIVELPGQTYAVMRFTGDRGAKAVERQTARLTAAVTGGGWRITGQPVAWFYDPPWTLPFLRRNEVAAPVEAVGG